MSNLTPTVIYNLPDSAAQRKKGQERVSQWKILNEGVGLEGWIVELKREREGRFSQHSSIC